jgi:hypothetical protein
MDCSREVWRAIGTLRTLTFISRFRRRMVISSPGLTTWEDLAGRALSKTKFASHNVCAMLRLGQRRLALRNRSRRTTKRGGRRQKQEAGAEAGRTYFRVSSCNFVDRFLFRREERCRLLLAPVPASCSCLVFLLVLRIRGLRGCWSVEFE